MASNGRLGIGLAFAIIILILLVTLLALPFLNQIMSSIRGGTPLTLTADAPQKQLYGSQIPLHVFLNYTSASPPANPALRITVTLGGQIIYDKTQAVQSLPSDQIYKVKLSSQNGILETYADSATIDVVFSAENVNQAEKTLSIQVSRPQATISATLPTSQSLLSGNQIKSGTYVFTDITVDYTGSDTGSFPVVAVVEMNSQYRNFYTMNSRLTQNFTDQGKTIWMVGTENIDAVRPVWKVPLDRAQFTVNTGGADQVAIKINVVLLLDLGNGHYLPLAETGDISLSVTR